MKNISGFLSLNGVQNVILIKSDFDILLQFFKTLYVVLCLWCDGFMIALPKIISITSTKSTSRSQGIWCARHKQIISQEFM